MPKRKKAAGGPKKSDQIRDFIQAHGGPDAMRNTDVVNGLKAAGVHVNASHVSNIMKDLKGGVTAPKVKKSKKKSGKRPGRPRKAPAAAATTSRGASLSEAHLLETKKLVKELGGFDAVRRALDTLSKLQT